METISNRFCTYAEAHKAEFPKIYFWVDRKCGLHGTMRPREKCVSKPIDSILELPQTLFDDLFVHKLSAFRERNQPLIEQQKKVPVVVVEIFVRQIVKTATNLRQCLGGTTDLSHRDVIPLPNGVQDVRLNDVDERNESARII